MYIKTPTLNKIMDGVKKMNPASDEVLLFYFGEHSTIEYQPIIDALNAKGINFAGAVFPGIIYDTQNYDSGVVISKYPSKAPIQIIKNLTDSPPSIPIDNSNNAKKKTALVLIDGLSPNIAEFLSKLYGNWGNKVDYIGGGAGSLSLEQSPCIFCKDGLLEDAAIVAILDYSIELGVRHGWEKLHGPIVATQTEKNTIYELNWDNAFEVYKEVVEEDAEIEFNDENFFDIAKGYPFGISIENQESIVRDPITVGEDGELVCVGKVDNNAVLNILKGSNDALIAAASQAANDVIQKTQNKAILDVLMVDCISRILFLQDDFGKELEAAYEPLQEKHEDLHLSGILTLGEISSRGDSPIYFYNKTMVLGAMCGE